MSAPPGYRLLEVDCCFYCKHSIGDLIDDNYECNHPDMADADWMDRDIFEIGLCNLFSRKGEG